MKGQVRDHFNAPPTKCGRERFTESADLGVGAQQFNPNVARRGARRDGLSADPGEVEAGGGLSP
jgi:hypothetical protein